MNNSTVYIICGPTASGKTSVAIALAKKLNGEIISADSMQIYKQMSIGTAKPDLEEIEGVKHYLIDVVNPDEDYSVAVFKEQATSAINKILSEGKTPIVAGGTGLYINALTYDLDFFDVSENAALREELSKKYDEDPQKLYSELIELDPESEKRIHINNKNRVVRRMEILLSGDKKEYNFDKKSAKYDFKIFALCPEREVLYENINSRVDAMMSMGLEAEVKKLYDKYGKNIKAFAAIGYKEFIPYFEGLCDIDSVVYNIKLNTRHFAKRQLTWFKRDERITRIDPTQYDKDELLALMTGK